MLKATRVHIPHCFLSANASRIFSVTSQNGFTVPMFTCKHTHSESLQRLIAMAGLNFIACDKDAPSRQDHDALKSDNYQCIMLLSAWCILVKSMYFGPLMIDRARQPSTQHVTLSTAILQADPFNSDPASLRIQHQSCKLQAYAFESNTASSSIQRQYCKLTNSTALLQGNPFNSTTAKLFV